MLKIASLLILAAVPAAAQAQNMPVSQFLGKAEALQKKGPLALLSGDIGKLKKEIENSAKVLRAEQKAAQQAGRRPATCMPEKIQLNPSELMKHFRSIPPAQRNMSVKTAFGQMMQKQYPCPA